MAGIRHATMNIEHYTDVIMTTVASQITSLTIVYSTVYSGAYQRKHQSSASLAFVRGIHRRPVNSPHKWPVTRKTFPFDYVIIKFIILLVFQCYLTSQRLIICNLWYQFSCYLFFFQTSLPSNPICHNERMLCSRAVWREMNNNEPISS